MKPNLPVSPYYATWIAANPVRKEFFEDIISAINRVLNSRDFLNKEDYCPLFKIAFDTYFRGKKFRELFLTDEIELQSILEGGLKVRFKIKTPEGQKAIFDVDIN